MAAITENYFLFEVRGVASSSTEIKSLCDETNLKMNAVCWDIMLTDVSEELMASINRVTRIAVI
jgi:hypothetical protein